LLELSALLPFPILLWEAQNTLYAPFIKSHQEWGSEPEKGDPEAQVWLSTLIAVSEKLGINLS
jgi:hypothetical protein